MHYVLNPNWKTILPVGLIHLLIYFWLCWVFVSWPFSSCNEQGLLPVAVHRLVVAMTPLVEHRL